MKISLDSYKIVHKILLGTNLKIYFIGKDDVSDRKILDLKEVVGFIDESHNKKIQTLQLYDSGGSYNLDLSMRLRNQEIITFPEVFIFVDQGCVNFCFRGVAKVIEFRDWTEKDKWLT